MVTIYRNDSNVKGKRKTNCFRPKSRHYDDELLLNRVRDYILKYEFSSNVSNILHKEQLAHIFKVKVSEMEQCLHKLKLEGLVSAPAHRAPHDSQRDPWGYTGNNGWAADAYYILAPEKVLKDLERNKLTKEQRRIALDILMHNRNKVITALNSTILNYDEEKMLLKFLVENHVEYSYLFFDKYSDENHRKKIISNVLTTYNPEAMYKLLCNKTLLKKERKRLFIKFLDVNPYNHHFSDYIKQRQIQPFEKEILIKMILKDGYANANLNVAQLILNYTKGIEINPKLEQELEGFILLHKLVGE